MLEMMTFPDTWEEFEEQYGITDRKQIYTNGARLIPSFRVKQWLDHIAERKIEPQTDNGIGCSRCEGRYDCYDRDMPHAVHCNNYGKVTDEPQTDCSWK